MVDPGWIYVAVEQGGKGTDGRGQLWVYEPSNVPILGITAVDKKVKQGGLLTIDGTGFDNYQGKSYPLLDGSPLPVVKWTDTQIIARVPFDFPKGNKQQVAVYKDGKTVEGGLTHVQNCNNDCD